MRVGRANARAKAGAEEEDPLASEPQRIVSTAAAAAPLLFLLPLRCWCCCPALVFFCFYVSKSDSPCFAIDSRCADVVNELAWRSESPSPVAASTLQPPAAASVRELETGRRRSFSSNERQSEMTQRRNTLHSRLCIILLFLFHFRFFFSFCFHCSLRFFSVRPLWITCLQWSIGVEQVSSGSLLIRARYFAIVHVICLDTN